MDEIYTLKKIRKVLNDGFPHCADSELRSWIHENGIHAEAIVLSYDIENAISADNAQWNKFLETIDD